MQYTVVSLSTCQSESFKLSMGISFTQLNWVMACREGVPFCRTGCGRGEVKLEEEFASYKLGVGMGGSSYSDFHANMIALPLAVHEIEEI